jgi:chorismate mutase
MNKEKLKIARNKIDRLDNNIFNLIKKRTKVVKEMMNLKRYKNEIVDHKRINTIIRNIRKKSLRNKIDPEITIKIWKAIIWSYIIFQKKNFKKK